MTLNTPPTRPLASEATLHIPRAAIVVPKAALRSSTIPRRTVICELDRITIDIHRSDDEHGRQSAVDVDALATGCVRVVEFSHQFVLIIVDCDIEAVI